MSMTKREPDQVIEYRISLQDKLNEQVDSVIATYSLSKIMTSMVALLSDGSAMLIIAGLLEAKGIINVIPDNLFQQIKDGIYEEFEPAMSAIDFALDVGEHEFRRQVATSPIVKMWVFLNTSGRALTEQMKR
jgi:hypothetical protein